MVPPSVDNARGCRIRYGCRLVHVLRGILAGVVGSVHGGMGDDLVGGDRVGFPGGVQAHRYHRSVLVVGVGRHGGRRRAVHSATARQRASR